MDPLTHSVFGVACAIAGTRAKVSRRSAALAGLAGGLLPDADVFLRSASDPLFNIEYHRHFTHSFAFLPVIALLGALIAAGIFRLFKKTVPWKLLLWPALLGGLSHLFCDAWTSYGTRLYWPFASTRVSFDWISVIDPVFTIPLTACIALAIRYASRKAATVGLAWAAVYLSFCLVQRHRADTALRSWLAANPLPDISRVELKPSFGNVIVWRGLIQTGQDCQVFAIRCPLRGSPMVWKGESQMVFADPAAAATALQIPASSTQARDIERLFHFSDGWVGRHPVHPLVLADLRYANVPTDIRPLWGIGLNPDQSDSHAAWRTFRGDTTPSLNRLLRIMDGNAPAAPPLQPDSTTPAATPPVATAP